MKLWNLIFTLFIITIYLSGCSANKSLIVLLPDPDGRAGAIEVKSKGGVQIVNKSYYFTQVKNSSTPPSVPRPMKKSVIMDVFGEALSAQADLPMQFKPIILHFKSGTVEITNQSQRLLPKILNTIKNRKSDEIYVIGHADRVGTKIFNKSLSSKRANWVRKFLIDSGINSGVIVVSYYGEAKPLIDTQDEVAEPLNRRVEVIVR